MQKRYQILIWEEPPYFVAKCLDLNVASQGRTRDEAIKRLAEAIDLFLEDTSQDFAPRKYQLEEITVSV